MSDSKIELYLTRHGETDGHTLPRYSGDPPLTELGREQSRLLAGALADRKIDRIYSSAMYRAKETASPLSETLGLPITAIAGLNEIAQGEFPGNEVAGRTRPLSEFAEWGGESAGGFSTRVTTAFNDVINDIVRAAFFLHDGVLNAVLDSIAGITPDGNIRTLFFNASITVITLRSERLTVQSKNDVSHLPRTLLTPHSYIS